MNQLKIYIAAVLSLFLTVTVSAETISQKQAQSMAQQFFNEANKRVVAPPKLVYNGRKLTTARLFTPFYVYNAANGGFVIISAENKAYPILGFSLKDNFDPEQLGETELGLLTSYAREIELIRYESNPVEEVEKRWIDYPGYVSQILTSRYIATDPTINLKEADEMLEYAVEEDRAIYSDIYTPGQWNEMIKDELYLSQSVPLWIVTPKTLLPAVIYGYQNDYFRIEMTTRNTWLMRLNATDEIEGSFISCVVNPIEIKEAIKEDIPFEDFDVFTAEVKEIEQTRTSIPSQDMMLIEATPRVRALGSGHFEILMPEEAVIARIYNLGGALVRSKTFSGTNAVNLDLSAEPQGFYFVNIIGESGQPYGIKIYR